MEDKKTIRIECTGAETKRLEELVIFQGNLKDLSKENYEKLKNEILTDGFSEPVAIWLNDNKWYVLNGTQRLRTLTAMQKEGYEIPALPVSIIQAKDVKQAARKCLALTSQFGNMTMDGLIEFQQTYELDIDEIKNDFRFPELRIDELDPDFEPVGADEQSKLDEKTEVFMECPHCGKRFEQSEAKAVN